MKPSRLTSAAAWTSGESAMNAFSVRASRSSRDRWSPAPTCGDGLRRRRRGRRRLRSRGHGCGRGASRGRRRGCAARRRGAAAAGCGTTTGTWTLSFVERVVVDVPDEVVSEAGLRHAPPHLHSRPVTRRREQARRRV